jgi:hypothetical protein
MALDWSIKDGVSNVISAQAVEINVVKKKIEAYTVFI